MKILYVGVLSLMGLSACSINHMNLRNTPVTIIQEAAVRLKGQGMTLDPAGKTPNQLRTAMFCWKEADYRRERREDFSKTMPGLVPFTHVGSQAEQDAVVTRCPAIFQIRVRAIKQDDGSRVEVDTAWWNTRRGPCKSHGEPLLGELECSYSFKGGQSRSDMNTYVYRLLQGL